MALPSGFTVDNEISLFEILDIPMTDVGFTVMDEMGSVSRGVSVNPSLVVKGEIETYMTTPSEFPPEKVTRLLKHIAVWDSISLKTNRMVDGSVGELTRVTQDYAETRDLIRQRVRILVPFYDRYAYLKKQSQGPEGFSGRNGGGSTSGNMIIH